MNKLTEPSVINLSACRAILCLDDATLCRNMFPLSTIIVWHFWKSYKRNKSYKYQKNINSTFMFTSIFSWLDTKIKWHKQLFYYSPFFYETHCYEFIYFFTLSLFSVYFFFFRKESNVDCKCTQDYGMYIILK